MRNSKQSKQTYEPSSPQYFNPIPISIWIKVNLNLEGEFSTQQERTWMVRITSGLLGALTHGLDTAPHSMTQIGIDLENHLSNSVYRMERTSFGTLPRIRIETVYKAFTCFAVINPLSYPYRRQMREHSMLTGEKGALAFLNLEADLEIDNFDLIMRDHALISGFRQR